MKGKCDSITELLEFGKLLLNEVCSYQCCKYSLKKKKQDFFFIAAKVSRVHFLKHFKTLMRAILIRIDFLYFFM